LPPRIATCISAPGPCGAAVPAPANSFRLKLHDPAFGFDLTLKPTQPLLLQGENGWSQKGPRPELASHYVSWPQLQVAGSLTLDGRPQPATGRAWFDHEWSSEVLAAGAVGWDWIGINLIDGGALMAFRIRDGAGATLYAHAALRDAAGRLTQFGAGEVKLHAAAPLDLAAQWRALPGADWKSAAARTPSKHCRLQDAQEIAAHRPLPVSYWEGLVKFAVPSSGRGYLELTGYAGALKL
jgi:predicted secreted hydrolase